jgi:hypothetical protein
MAFFNKENRTKRRTSLLGGWYYWALRTFRSRPTKYWIVIAFTWITTVLFVTNRQLNDGQEDTLSQNIISEYIVWTYPAPIPPSTQVDILKHLRRCRDQYGKTTHKCQLLCSYQPCRDFVNEHVDIVPLSTDINLPKLLALTNDKSIPTSKQYQQFRIFLEEHYWFRLEHGLDFPHHVQSITVLSLLNFQSSQEPVCVLVPHKVHPTDTSRFFSGAWWSAVLFPSSSSLIRVCQDDVTIEHQSYDPTKVITSDLSLSSSSSSQQKQQRQEWYPPRNDLPPFATYGLDFNSTQSPHFGILDYDGRVQYAEEANSGDEMQTLPGLQFLPYLTNFVERDYGVPESTNVDYMFGNAWWGTSSAFPPPNGVQMILSSIHTSGDFLNVVQSKISYFQQYNQRVGPIGARDIKTYQFLKGKCELAVYMSSCFTQMMGINRPVLFNDIAVATKTTTPTPNTDGLSRDTTTDGHRRLIVAVDVDPKLLPPSIRKKAKFLSANVDHNVKGSRKARFDHTMALLRLYKDEAMVVITSRIHAALPASVYGVPVIFMEPNNEELLPGGGGGRTVGLSNLFHRVTYGTPDVETRPQWNFDVERMEPNPGVHRQDRYRASFWNYIKNRGPHWYSDSARLFGMVPLERLGRDIPTDREEFGRKVHDLFHFIITTGPTSVTWRIQRAIEAVFFYHPNAKVIIHSNTIPIHGVNRLDIFAETGYDLEVRPYHFLQWMRESPSITEKDIIDFQKVLPRRNTAQYWYSHKTDLIRLLIIDKFGGVYLDTDQHLIKPIPKSFTNVIGYQDKSAERYKDGFVNGAVMIFEKANPFIQSVLQEAMRIVIYKYVPTEWSIIGPYLLTDKWKEREEKGLTNVTIQVVEPEFFYPYYWEVSKRCFTELATPTYHPVYNPITENTYSVHLNTKVTGELDYTIPGTVCDSLFHDHCIFCDEIYTDFQKASTEHATPPPTKTQHRTLY